MVSIAVAILLGPLIPGIALIAMAASRQQDAKPSRLMLWGVRTLIVGLLVSGFLILSISRA